MVRKMVASQLLVLLFEVLQIKIKLHLVHTLYNFFFISDHYILSLSQLK